MLRTVVGEVCGDEVEAVNNPSGEVEDVCVHKRCVA